MAFSYDFKACLAPLPTPAEALDTLADIMEFIEKLHGAFEAAGGEAEVTLAAAATVGAAAGVDEAVLEVAATAGETAITVYIAACAGCAVKVAGADAVSKLLATSADGASKDALETALNEQQATDAAVV